jgi:dihydropteroate synthase
MARVRVKDGYLLFRETPLIMGILNITPDSFYDGGRYINFEKAFARAFEIIEQGADLIDIGGESTRPGAEPVTLEEEERRVIPVIKEIRKKSDIPISIDTYKSEIAEKALIAGANIVNDISGMKFDEKMPFVIKRYVSGVILMHIRGTPRDMQKNPYYENTVQEIKNEIQERVEYAKSFDIEDEQIIIDPGIGFAKRVYDNLIILRDLEEFKKIGYPLLIGHSRKSFIGKVLGIEDPEYRKEGTLAVSSYLILKKADILRVHDVKETFELRKMLKAIEDPQIYT